MVLLGVGEWSVAEQGVQKTLVQKSSSPETRAQAVIARAKAFLGGPRLEQVRALESVRSNDNEILRVLFPTCYQLETARSGKILLVSFDGNTIWSRSEPESQLPPVNVDAATLKMRGLNNVAQYALMYLLRDLPSRPLKPVWVGAAQCAPVKGECIEFRRTDASEAHPWRMAFHAETFQPLALILYASNSPEGPPTIQSIDQLDDYRPVDDVRFPFRITHRNIDLITGEDRTTAVWQYKQILVNPPLKASDFKKPAAKK